MDVFYILFTFLYDMVNPTPWLSLADHLKPSMFGNKSYSPFILDIDLQGRNSFGSLPVKWIAVLPFT